MMQSSKNAIFCTKYATRYVRDIIPITWDIGQRIYVDKWS